MFATKGIYTSLSSELADPTLGSQRTYLRHRFFARFYYPLPLGAVLRINTEAGLVTSRSPRGVPLYDRFFLGGILSVRGFRFNDLGPHTSLPSTIDPTAANSTLNTLRIGGNAMLRANVEIEFPIVTAVGIKGVIFTDAGNVWNLENQYCQLPGEFQPDSSRQDLRLQRHSHLVRFGVRWFSPMGPLRFEWGFPYKKRFFDKAVDFQFTIGQFF